MGACRDVLVSSSLSASCRSFRRFQLVGPVSFTNRALLRYNADPNVCNGQGRTVEDVAARSADHRTSSLMLYIETMIHHCY